MAQYKEDGLQNGDDTCSTLKIMLLCAFIMARSSCTITCKLHRHRRYCAFNRCTFRNAQCCRQEKWTYYSSVQVRPCWPRTSVHRCAKNICTAYAWNNLLALLVKRFNILWMWFYDACLVRSSLRCRSAGRGFSLSPLACGAGGRFWLPSTFPAALFRATTLYSVVSILTIKAAAPLQSTILMLPSGLARILKC